MSLSTTNVSNMKRILPSILCLVLGSACGGGEEDDSGAGTGGSTAAGTGGSSGGSSGNGGSSGEVSGKGGSSGSSAGTGGSSSGKGGGAGTSGSGGESGSGGNEPQVGVCGLRSVGVVTADDFETYEEFYLLGEEGFGEEVCIVRVDVVRVGEAPAGCDEMAGQQDECLWTHQVEYRNPEVVLDEDGACANSDLALDAAAIAALEGKQMGYGYVFEYQGHNSVLMEYSVERSAWEPGVNAGWTESTGDFQFDRRDGFCDY
jgi:hypothetical protein